MSIELFIAYRKMRLIFIICAIIVAVGVLAFLSFASILMSSWEPLIYGAILGAVILLFKFGHKSK